MSIPPRTVTVVVINDFMCPNCCVGQHELLSAIAYSQNVLHLNLQFELQFLPFKLISDKCLSDDMPKVSKVQFFTEKLGAENFSALQASMEKWSKEKGIALSFKGIMGQTTRAHRLSRKAYLAGGQKLQLPLLCNIFKANLTDGEDISDLDTLANISQRIGLMPRDKAIEFLKSDELEADVMRICDENKTKGIQGVPTILIDGKWALTGGLSSEIFIKVFQKLAACGTNTPTPGFATPSSMSGDLVTQPLQPLC